MDGYKYYKYLRLHFKDPKEIKAAWREFTKQGYGKIRGADALKKGKDFWGKITKDVSLFDAYQTKVFGRLAKWTSKFLGKASPYFAVADTVSSTVDAVKNFASGEINQGIASTGEALLAGSAVLAYSGAGAPVAAGVAAVGGALWVGAKIYEHRKFIGKAVGSATKFVYEKTPIGDVHQKIKSTVSDGIKNTAAKAIDTVKGLFDLKYDDASDHVTWSDVIHEVILC